MKQLNATSVSVNQAGTFIIIDRCLNQLGNENIPKSYLPILAEGELIGLWTTSKLPRNGYDVVDSASNLVFEIVEAGLHVGLIEDPVKSLPKNFFESLRKSNMELANSKDGKRVSKHGNYWKQENNSMCMYS